MPGLPAVRAMPRPRSSMPTARNVHTPAGRARPRTVRPRPRSARAHLRPGRLAYTHASARRACLRTCFGRPCPPPLRPAVALSGAFRSRSIRIRLWSTPAACSAESFSSGDSCGEDANSELNISSRQTVFPNRVVLQIFGLNWGIWSIWSFGLRMGRCCILN
jgi:hypothetical protein